MSIVICMRLSRLDSQDFDILRRKAASGGDRRDLARNDELRQAVGRRLRTLVESPETARAARLAELHSYREQLLEDHYAMTLPVGSSQIRSGVFGRVVKP